MYPLCFPLITKLYHNQPSAHFLCFAILKRPALGTLATAVWSWQRCKTYTFIYNICIFIYLYAILNISALVSYNDKGPQSV